MSKELAAQIKMIVHSIGMLEVIKKSLTMAIPFAAGKPEFVQLKVNYLVWAILYVITEKKKCYSQPF